MRKATRIDFIVNTTTATNKSSVPHRKNFVIIWMKKKNSVTHKQEIHVLGVH